ncbi:Pick C1-like protein 1 [Seminavis robusta]|uniref:Pick C1-like protein 1 n=1 Tax=Seminavis robusta TaxID=568900 RepID=A0A9N8DNX5_9STRA|nr:Pick C1-like protein 1 [Seminavis robusta]|eukprot:Sro267_g103410.1 Pick C1-like protein 1 (1008) ;mRNA; r:36705-39969
MMQEDIPEKGPRKPQTAPTNKYESNGCVSDFVYVWRRATQLLHLAITKFVIAVSLLAARNPKRCIGAICLVSITLITAGLFTNFELSADNEQIFAPVDCLPREHFQWVQETFPSFARPLILILHANGDNVVTYEATRRLFNATDSVRAMDGYEAICAGSNGEHGGCSIAGPTRFWEHNATLFEEQSQGSDELVMHALSQDSAGGTPFPHSLFIGNLHREAITGEDGNNGTLITSAQSLVNLIDLPSWPNGESEEFELEMLNLLKPIKAALEAQVDQPYRLEIYTMRSLPDELTRAISEDLPLIPCVFAIMAAFTCMVFCRRDIIQSRALLGIGSVVTIMLSIMSGFGLAFCIGLPFTSMTSVLPFVIFGIGLDDTFIIVGAYLRTDPTKDPVERIRETMEEVGMSVSITTITTTVAFVLGTVTTSIPIIQYLCLYAFPTICIDFLYQISFFVAIIVLDERRIAANRRDCCICFSAKDRGTEEDTDGLEDDVSQVAVPIKAPVVDRFMDWYCDHLLHPVVKVVVMIVFTALVGVCIYSTTLLKQEFKPADFLPQVSYAMDFLDAMDLYTNRKLGVAAYFRDVDQSDPQVQQQMIDYINDLAALPQIQAMPELCWVTDFQKLMNGDNPAFEEYSSLLGENSTLTFTEKLDLMLSVPEINEAYGSSILRNEDGEIVASSCFIAVNHVDLDVVKEQSIFLADQRKVAEAQPINQDGEGFKFFAFDLIYFIWEFYTIVPSELAFTTVSGVVAVTALAFILIPHWSAAFFILPLMCILNIDLLGMLQFAGLSINPLTYICLVISVGLLVDFIMHIILRYYESTKPTREEKVKDTLRTMGASILVGGLSTCLGVVPLAFSTNGIIQTVFIMFIAMVSLGLAHGLILLPVLLSYVGPTVCIKPGHNDHDNLKKTPVITKASSRMAETSLSRSKLAVLPGVPEDEAECSETRNFRGSEDGETRSVVFTSDDDDDHTDSEDGLMTLSFDSQEDLPPGYIPPRVCLERNTSFGTEYSL